MSLSLYNIKKWVNMLTGKSILHVNQDIGKYFSIKEVKGYYNNLTEKVTKQPELLDSDEVPVVATESGEKVFFPVAIFQYGLGTYDLYLNTGKEIYLKKFYDCVNWSIENQEENGGFKNFSFIYPNNPYGSMCQGEAVSLFVRAYVNSKNIKYLSAAKNALNFMLLDVNDGGTTYYKDGKVIFLEYTHKAAVLNGWIFSVFGLFDYLLIDDLPEYREIFNKTINSLKELLPQFDNGYWSMYDLDSKITSPFYHNLHIAQVQALFEITGDEIFNEYAERWKVFSESRIKKTRAFIKKSFQKIMEK